MDFFDDSDDRKEIFNLDAEKLLLGEVLFNNELLQNIIEILKPEHFYEEAHGRLFAKILHCYERGIVADAITLKIFINNDPAFADEENKDAGYEYLKFLIDLWKGIANLANIAQMIKDLFIKRNLLKIANSAIQNVCHSEKESPEIIEEIEIDLFKISDINKTNETTNLKDLMKNVIETAEYAHKNRHLLLGLDSGFNDLNNLLNGFINSDLIILAARPSMGKTALGLNFALNIAKHLQDLNTEKKNYSVGIFSLEMSKEQLAMRMLSIEAEINSNHIRGGKLAHEQMQQLIETSREFDELNIFIDDTPSISLFHLRNKARHMKKKYNLQCIIIDYLQLMHGSKKTNDYNRVQEISEITQGLKSIAKELDIPVIALSQLSRAVEQRDDKRPQLSDLRDSGSIEQDADIVMFLYREEYYEERKEPTPDTEKYEEWQQKMEKIYNIAELIVAKHRNGPIGNVKLFFDKNNMRFRNLKIDNI